MLSDRKTSLIVGVQAARLQIVMLSDSERSPVMLSDSETSLRFNALAQNDGNNTHFDKLNDLKQVFSACLENLPEFPLLS